MKITQEVREFAAKQNAGADTFLAAAPTARPELVEGLSLLSATEEGRASTGSARTDLGDAESEAGMAEMSEKFRKEGGEIYVPAAE